MVLLCAWTSHSIKLWDAFPNLHVIGNGCAHTRFKQFLGLAWRRREASDGLNASYFFGWLATGKPTLLRHVRVLVESSRYVGLLEQVFDAYIFLLDLGRHDLITIRKFLLAAQRSAFDMLRGSHFVCHHVDVFNDLTTKKLGLFLAPLCFLFGWTTRNLVLDTRVVTLVDLRWRHQDIGMPRLSVVTVLKTQRVDS